MRHRLRACLFAAGCCRQAVCRHHGAGAGGKLCCQVRKPNSNSAKSILHIQPCSSTAYVCLCVDMFYTSVQRTLCLGHVCVRDQHRHGSLHAKAVSMACITATVTQGCCTRRAACNTLVNRLHCVSCPFARMLRMACGLTPASCRMSFDDLHNTGMCTWEYLCDLGLKDCALCCITGSCCRSSERAQS